MTDAGGVAVRSSRLLIDELQMEDAAVLYAIRSHPDVTRFQDWQPGSVHDAAAFISEQRAIRLPSLGQWSQRAIRLLSADGSCTLVGDVGLLFPSSAGDSVQLGITVSPSHQRQGVGREALQAVLELLFTQLRYRRVVASVDPRNAACVSLMQSVGLRQEAHHRESLLWRGDWVDDVVFALLAKEWPLSLQQPRGRAVMAASPANEL